MNSHTLTFPEYARTECTLGDAPTPKVSYLSLSACCTKAQLREQLENCLPVPTSKAEVVD